MVALVAVGGTYQGVFFPDGASSFADEVLRYDPSFGGGGAPAVECQEATRVLGPPDEPAASGCERLVSLGDGGLLELGFTDNWLTNSGDATPDLWLFEVGNVPEAIAVAVRPADAASLALAAATGVDANGDGYFEVGVTVGKAGVDVDAHFPGLVAGQIRFDAVQLVDSGAGTGGTYAGADVEAVGAIASPLPTLAAVVSRSAAGNPDSFSLTPPVLGTTMFATVQVGTTTGHLLALVFGFESSAEIPLSGGQTLLCFDGGAGEVLRLLPAFGPVAVFPIPVPNDAALVGREYFTQALHFGGITPFALSNAQDIVLGF